jgi:type VI secretion system secreted protein VgrG
VGGEVLLYAGPVVAGLAGGATGNIAKQLLKNVSGKQCGFAAGSLVFESSVGAVSGFVPGVRIPGITAGRGSFNQIYRQVVTKAEGGTISSITPQTAAKMVVGRAVATGLVPGTGAAAAAGASGLIPSSESSRPCKKK